MKSFLGRISTKLRVCSMQTTDRFLKFAAECESMAKLSPSPDNRAVWNRLAQRWIRCAEFSKQLDGDTQSVASPRRRQKSLPRIATN
jgi:hypothetical protein